MEDFEDNALAFAMANLNLGNLSSYEDGYQEYSIGYNPFNATTAKNLSMSEKDPFWNDILTMSVCKGTNGATLSEILFGVTKWIEIVEGYSKMTVSFMGAIFNLISILIMVWPPRKLTSLFHGMVVQLLAIETMSIVLDMMHSFRVLNEHTQCGSYVYCIFAAYVFYPLENMLTFASIFIMVIIAKQQTHALRSPLAFQQKLKIRSLTSTLKTTMPAFLGAFVIGLPIVFESVIVQSHDPILATYDQPENSSQAVYCPQLSRYRISQEYVIGYRIIVVFLSTLVMPFGFLAHYAYHMWWILFRRSQLVNRPQNQSAQSRAMKEEAAKNCKAFLCLMLLLAICYCPSLILGIQESMNTDQYSYGVEFKCSAIPLWVHKLETVTQLAMTCFASLSGIVYCASCPSFRKKVLHIIGKLPRQELLQNQTDLNSVDNENSLNEVDEDMSRSNGGIALEMLPKVELQIQAENMLSTNATRIDV